MVLHVGRLAAEKNYPLLFRAFDVFRRHEPRAKLVIVGDGPLLSACQKQRPDAVFTGFYTGVNLARHYASGDVYLHGSITETFGNVITEALASGLALGAFDYAAAHEFVRHGENGLVAPPGNETAFLAHAERLAREPDLRARLRTAAPASVSALSWDAVIDRFAADLTEATEEFKGSRSSGARVPALAPELSPGTP